jgi:peptidoglycan/LPS O-acetylase OafA/YrhL
MLNANPPAPVPPSKLWPLEAIRGAAAVYVVAYHAQLGGKTWMRSIFALGPEAVMVFFLLSGFVIYYSHTARRTPDSFRVYFLRRFRRIYPLFILALVFTYLMACVREHQMAPPELKTAAGNLLMLQDITWVKAGAWVPTYGGNDPLWSLSYEWWFYMMFFPIIYYLSFAPAKQRWLVFGISLLGSLSCVVHPSTAGLITGYFFVWWSGVELGREYRMRNVVTWREQATNLLLLTSLAAVWSIPIFRAALDHQRLTLSYEPVLEFRHFFAAILIVLFALIAFRWRMFGFERLLRPFCLIAPISYALYIFHQPVIALARHAAPLHQALLYLGLLLPLCCVLELFLQPQINRMFDGLIKSKGQRAGRNTLMAIPSNVTIGDFEPTS